MLFVRAAREDGGQPGGTVMVRVDQIVAFSAVRRDDWRVQLLTHVGTFVGATGYASEELALAAGAKVVNAVQARWPEPSS